MRANQFTMRQASGPWAQTVTDNQNHLVSFFSPDEAAKPDEFMLILLKRLVSPSWSLRGVSC